MNRSQRCGQCRGCTAKPCGRCIYCQDSPQFGGPGVKKQSCIERRCLKVLENRLQRDGPSLKAKIGCGACDECLTPDCHSCLICLDKKFFDNRYLPGAMCAKKRCNQARSLELAFPPQPAHQQGIQTPHHHFDGYPPHPPRHLLEGLYGPVFHHHHQHPHHLHHPHHHPHHALAGPLGPPPPHQQLHLLPPGKRGSPTDETEPLRKRPNEGLLMPGLPASVQQVPQPYPMQGFPGGDGTVFSTYPIPSTGGPPSMMLPLSLPEPSGVQLGAPSLPGPDYPEAPPPSYSLTSPVATLSSCSNESPDSLGHFPASSAAPEPSSMDSQQSLSSVYHQPLPSELPPKEPNTILQPTLQHPPPSHHHSLDTKVSPHLSPSYWQPYGLAATDLDAFQVDPSALIPPSLSGSPQVVLQPL